MTDTLHLNAPLLLALGTGVAIAAASGLRAFLPVFALGLAARLGIVRLDPSVAWLSASPTLWALGVATVLEVLGDKIPVVDHVLDLVATVVRPLAGGLAAYAALAQWPQPFPVAFALIAGAGAFGVHALKAKTRVGSTALTGGAANPVLSTAEDLGAVGLTAVGVLLPVIALVLIVALVLLVRGLVRGRRGPGGP